MIMTTNPKKKVQPKESASKRRRDANVELCNLAELLPLPVPVASRLDKTSIVRLSIAYRKLRELFPSGLGRDWGEEPVRDSIWENSGLAESGKFLNKALHGFVFVLGADGKILYISEEASAQLGYSQVQLTGQNFWGYVHTYDVEEVKANLWFDVDIPAWKAGKYSLNGTEVPRTFTVRMKCILPKRQAELAADGYKVIHCKGYLKLKRKEPQRDCPANPIYGLAGVVAVGHSLSPTPNAELKLNSLDFMLRTELSLKIIYVEPGSQKITGYEPLQLKDKSFYRLVHPYDCKQIEEVHVLTVKKSQAITGYYRFLTGGGGWIWLQSSCIVVANNKADADHCILFVNSVLSKPDHRNKGFIMDQTYPKTNKAVTKKSRTTAKNAKKLPYHAQRTTTTINANVTNIFPSQREPSSIYAQPTQPHSTLEMRSSPLCYAPVNLQYGSNLNFYRPEQTENLCGSSASASYSLPQSHVMGLTYNDDLYQDSLTTSSNSHLDPVTKHFSYRKTTHTLPMHHIKPSDTADFHQSQERFPAKKFVSHPENSFQTQISQPSSISPVAHGRSCHKNEQMLPFYRWNSFQEAKFRQFTDLYAPALAEDDESTERAFVPSFDGSSDSLDHLNQYCAPAFASCNISKYSANSAPNNIDVSATCSNVQVALDSQSVAANSSKNSEHANALGRSIAALATNETGPLSISHNSSFISNSLSCSILAKPKFNGRTLFEGSSVNEFDPVYNFNSVSISQNKTDLLIDLLFSSPIEKSCKQSDSTSVSQTLYVNTWTESIKDLHGMNINTTTKSHAKEQTTGHYDSKTEHYELKVIPASANVTDSNADTSYNLSNTVPVKNDDSASFSASYDDSNTTIFDLELIEPTIPVTSSMASSTVSNSNTTNLSFPPHAEVDSCGIGYLPLDHRISTESFTSIIPDMSEDFLAPFRGLTEQKNPAQSANDRSASPSSASLGYISGSSFLSSPCNFSECRELATFGSNQNDEVQTSRFCDSSPSF